MINTVVVGHGLAGRVFHCPLIKRQANLRLAGIVVRNPEARAAAAGLWGTEGLANLDEALADPSIDLVVIATPHDTHPDLVIRTLEAGKACVVDKVMALTSSDADRMIAARDRSGKMLSVFHNRRWDGDFLTLQETMRSGRLGKPLVFESSVMRYSAPRTWRGTMSSAGSILHDWGAHLVDQALTLELGSPRIISGWLTDAPWQGVDSGGQGRMTLEFESGILFHIETSRICRLDKPRWFAIGTEGCYQQFGLDPQEDALRAGDLESASLSLEHHPKLASGGLDGATILEAIDPIQGRWDSYYQNIADHMLSNVPLAVTAEQAGMVVRVLEAALESARKKQSMSADL